MSFFKEFKEFISKGSIVDLAVAVVIGGAFGQIVTSAVNDLLMPIIGVIVGGIDFSSFKYVLKEAVTGVDGKVAKPEVAIYIGKFIQVTVNFLIIALFIFTVLKGLMRLKKSKEEAEATPSTPAVPAEPSEEVKLLTEIRDLLKEKESGK